MKSLHLIAVGASLCLASTVALAQFVKGNEAVKAMPDGSTRVETPPSPGNTLAPPCPAAKAGCSGGIWSMVETPTGLIECTEIYARPTTCRASTYGTEKRSRLWIVKTRTGWMQCQYPNLTSKCVSTKALPYSALQ